jgi:hypothetical protein
MPLNPALAGVTAALFLAGRPDAGLAPIALLAGCAAFLTTLDFGISVWRGRKMKTSTDIPLTAVTH